MEKFQTNKYDEKVIELTNSNDIEKLYDNITNEKNFILEWVENNEIKSKLIISNNIIGGVQTGDITISSKQTENK